VDYKSVKNILIHFLL